MRVEVLRPGTGDQKLLRQQTDTFFNQAEGRAAFFDTVKTAHPSQLPALISLAGFSRHPEAVAFLKEQATQKIPIAPIVAADATIDLEGSLSNSLIAASALVEAYASNPGGLTDDLNNLLSTADAYVAQVAAVDLYTRVLLTEKHRQILDRRGIFNHFREHTNAEYAALITANPGTRNSENPEPDPAGRVGPSKRNPWGGQTAPIDGAPVSGAGRGRGLGAMADDPNEFTLCATADDPMPWERDLQDAAYDVIGLCNQDLINDVWKRFHMGKADWGRYGGADSNACWSAWPIGRTFNGLGVLNYAGTDAPDCNFKGTNVLNWASCWSAGSIVYLKPDCKVGSPWAAMTYNKVQWDGDNRTELYNGFWYHTEPQARAGMIFHEARHADGWCSHTDNCRGGPNACDRSYEGGCTGFLSSDGKGAYGYEVVYLSWFLHSAQPDMTNPTLAEHTKAFANDRLGKNFEINPCFELGVTGVPVRTCPDDEPPPPVPSGPF
jgi:hypothetical protein